MNNDLLLSICSDRGFRNVELKTETVRVEVISRSETEALLRKTSHTSLDGDTDGTRDIIIIVGRPDRVRASESTCVDRAFRNDILTTDVIAARAAINVALIQEEIVGNFDVKVDLIVQNKGDGRIFLVGKDNVDAVDLEQL